MINNVALYLDLDGVFADFVSRAYEIYDDFAKIHGIYHDMIKTDDQQKMRDELIQSIKDTPDFWSNLDWENGGEELFRFIFDNFNQDTIAVLTAPIHEDIERCSQQKWSWVCTRFNYTIPKEQFFTDHNKYQYVNKLPGKHQILIDDRTKNINKWIDAGGIGILHDSNNPQTTIKALSQFI